MTRIKLVKLSLSLVKGLLLILLLFNQGDDPVAVKKAQNLANLIGWGVALVEIVERKPKAEDKNKQTNN